ncbi:DUF2497 domain-containing protein [Hyphomicrobium sp.]|uniref:DUF2497 domain-containing protein n=1 Tax=Hyphomicrobium sp. TaxID=82 RepID=UPI0025C06BFC|nr:DUF2497 domain-containing protein [Hyphomicrobium sp.]MCC7251075.1 DUF2497 domain-containing protein [Hyphomicrobium sp.]
MNRPDKAGEPSMEEILASIRQIIADEPSTDQSEPAIEANPLVPQSLASKSPEPRGPLADRLSGVLKGGPLPPTSPLGSKRPLSFDQDLADMFDEQDPSNGSAAAAPKPDIRVSPGLSHPMGPKSFVALGEEAPKPASGDGAAALAPQPAAPAQPALQPEPPAPSQPFGSVEPPQAEPAPPKTFGFPPLRKTSFYPPQPKTPAAPTYTQAGPAPGVTGPEASATPAAASDLTAAASASLDDALKRIEGSLGSAAPADVGGTGIDATLASNTQAFSHGGSSAAETRVPESPFDSSAPRREAPEAPLSSFAPQQPVSASPIQPEVARPAAGQPFTAPPQAFGNIDHRSYDARPAAPIDSRPAEPRPYSDPFAQSVRGAPGFGASPRFAPEPDMSAAAAHQALDALAQGLAAASAASASAEPVSQAIPLTPVIETLDAEMRSAPAPSTLPATVSQAGNSPVNRTLEDAVADMLRPMLQQWVADNMPRIIEKALRNEVSNSVRPGHKPPGS